MPVSDLSTHGALAYVSGLGLLKVGVLLSALCQNVGRAVVDRTLSSVASIYNLIRRRFGDLLSSGTLKATAN